MCNGGDCHRKSTCYRHVANADSYQCFYAQVPMDASGGCDQYWEIKPKIEKSSAKKPKKRIL